MGLVLVTRTERIRIGGERDGSFELGVLGRASTRVVLVRDGRLIPVLAMDDSKVFSVGLARITRLIMRPLLRLDFPMDNNETTVETTEDFNFGKEIAKAVAISTAISAGTVAGLVVVGLTITKFQEFNAARKAKKEAKTEA